MPKRSTMSRQVNGYTPQGRHSAAEREQRTPDGHIAQGNVADILGLQRTLGNRATSVLLARAQRVPGQRSAGLIARSLLIQRGPLYDAAEQKAKKKKALTQQDLEDAIKEFLVEMVANQGYEDSDGNPVDTNEMQGVNFIWDADYAAAQGLISLPSEHEVKGDLKSGTLKMALRHEMGHYIRQIQTSTGIDDFQDGEDVIDNIDWNKWAQKYPTGNMEYWKEEVRSDLKSVVFKYRNDGKYPSNSDLTAYQAMLGPVVDAMHPPAAMRVSAMKTFIKSSQPTKCCYITTACLEARSLADDCEELLLLRHFRDSYLLHQPHGPELIEIYYEHAPAIVRRIDEDEEREQIYAEIYAVIRACADAIKRGEMAWTHQTYCEMVELLREQFIPEEQLPAYQR